MWKELSSSNRTLSVLCVCIAQFCKNAIIVNSLSRLLYTRNNTWWRNWFYLFIFLILRNMQRETYPRPRQCSGQPASWHVSKYTVAANVWKGSDQTSCFSRPDHRAAWGGDFIWYFGRFFKSRFGSVWLKETHVHPPLSSAPQQQRENKLHYVTVPVLADYKLCFAFFHTDPWSPGLRHTKSLPHTVLWPNVELFWRRQNVEHPHRQKKTARWSGLLQSSPFASP